MLCHVQSMQPNKNWGITQDISYSWLSLLTSWFSWFQGLGNPLCLHFSLLKDWSIETGIVTDGVKRKRSKTRCVINTILVLVVEVYEGLLRLYKTI